jgi:hypothetical protein
MPDRATQYLMRRVHGASVDEFDLQMHGAVIDLLLSEIPLEPHSVARQLMAELHERLTFPSKRRDNASRQRAQLIFDDYTKRHLIAKGKLPGEADEAVADILRVSTQALRKRRSRRK